LGAGGKCQNQQHKYLQPLFHGNTFHRSTCFQPETFQAWITSEVELPKWNSCNKYTGVGFGKEENYLTASQIRKFLSQKKEGRYVF
jgi:hypothetical protein